MWPVQRRLLQILFALLFCAAATPATADLVATAARVGDHGGKTRFVLELTEKAPFQVFVLPDPYRVVIDFPVVDWHLPPHQDQRPVGLIDSYRFGLFRPDTSRVVLDVRGPVEVTAAELLPPRDGKPYRFYIDIRPTGRDAFLAAAARDRERLAKIAAIRPEPLPATPPVAKEARRYTIVIDAGHGGVDPGTIGVHGGQEKDLVLAVARRIAGELHKSPQYRVVMTRSSDVFLSLRDRVAVARKEEADLFISIHADSIKSPKVRGATVYTLSETASDDEAEALAHKENKSDVIAGVDLALHDDAVSGILIDLAQRETKNFAAAFAKILLPEITQRNGGVSRDHRYAGFRVLRAPDVPSVLVELGYLSNSQDYDFLFSKAGQERMTEGVVSAVDRYFREIRSE
ncbi:N-acetylmuramoyl-L-alanine amidase [Oceanibacterium hippocampi]|uniref:N-acetylmuramoyl-L-alanine amidase n=1 Tax=Oceanibacterium hippocampi TaxID=745714 RepID=A0A1Y5SV02_9PROT|nr:N-acetylmuramoyl-L-alanine amidase [Oceanibacterium hippocampi]SLN49020.1 N-acetylmuramoyl-L-alanine amidase AmiC precursor [Oceanibacterium hippocampi]